MMSNMLRLAVFCWISQGLNQNAHDTQATVSAFGNVNVDSSLIQEKAAESVNGRSHLKESVKNKLAEAAEKANQLSEKRAEATTKQTASSDSVEESWAQDGEAEKQADEEAEEMDEMLGTDGDDDDSAEAAPVNSRLNQARAHSRRLLNNDGGSKGKNALLQEYAGVRNKDKSLDTTLSHKGKKSPSDQEIKDRKTRAKNVIDVNKLQGNYDRFNLNEQLAVKELWNTWFPDHLKLRNKIYRTNVGVAKQHDTNVAVFAAFQPIVDANNEFAKVKNKEVKQGRFMIAGDKVRLETIGKGLNGDTKIANTMFKANYKRMMGDQIKATTGSMKEYNGDTRASAKASMTLSQQAAGEARTGESNLLKQAIKNDPMFDAQLAKLEGTMEAYEGPITTEYENTNEDLEERVTNLMESSDINDPGLEYMKEESQVPLEDFESDSEEATEEMEERAGDSYETLKDSLADTHDVAKDSTFSSASSADSVAMTVPMRGMDGMINMQKTSKMMGVKMGGAIKKMSAKLPGVYDALDKFDTANRKVKVDQEKEVVKMTKTFTEKLAGVRDKGESKIAAEKEGLELQLAGKGAAVQSMVKKLMSQARAGARQVISSTNGAYDSYTATQMNTLAGDERTVQKTSTKVDQIGKATEDQAGALLALSDRVKDIRKVEAENLDFGAEQKRAAMAVQQETYKAVSELVMDYMTKIQDQKTRGQDVLAAATESIGGDITKKSADVMYDVNQFSDKGNDQANSVKQGMVMAERQMGEQLEKLEGAAFAVRDIPARTNFTSNMGVETARGEQTAQEEMGAVLSKHTVEGYKKSTDMFSQGAMESESKLQQKILDQAALVKMKEEALRSRMADALKDQEAEKAKQGEIGNGLRVQGGDMGSQGNKFGLEVDDFKAKADAELESITNKIASTRQALGQARYASSLDVKQKTKDVITNFEEQQAKMLENFGNKASQASTMMSDEMGSIINSTNLQVSDGHESLAGGFEDGLKQQKLSEEELTKFKQGEAQDLLAPKLEEADKALKSMDQSQREAEAESNEIITNTQSFAAVNQATINEAAKRHITKDKQVEGRVHDRLKELGVELQDVREKFAGTMSGVEAQAMRSIGDMREKARVSAGAVGGATRDIDSQSRAMSATMNEQTGRIEDRISSEENTVSGSGESARLEAMRASSGIEVLGKNVARESMELDYGAEQLEKAANAVIGGVDSEKMKGASNEKLNAFKSMLTEAMGEEKDTTKNALKIINNLLFSTNMQMDGLTKRVEELGKGIQAPISEIPKNLGPLEATMNSDEVWARSTLQDLHDLGETFKKHVQERRERLDYVHDETEGQLERATQMSQMADGGALDGVLARLAQAMKIDRDINWQIESAMTPQTEHWRSGIGTVFDELGVSLDLDAVAAKADAAMARAKMQGQNMDSASQQVEAALRAEQKKNEMALASIQHKQKSLIREAMRNGELSAQEKIAQVKKIKDEMQKEGQMYASQLANMADTVNKQDIETQEKANKLGQLMDRAQLVAEGPQDAPSEDSLAQQQKKVKEQLFALKNPDSVPEFMREGEEPGSLLETAGKVDTGAVATFRTIEAKLESADKKRDVKESEIEDALENLMNQGKSNSTNVEAEATLRTH